RQDHPRASSVEVRLAACLFAALVLAACGGRETADDQGLHREIQNNRGGAEVTFDATALSDPVQSGDHERFEVRAATGEMLEADRDWQAFGGRHPVAAGVDPACRQCSS